MNYLKFSQWHMYDRLMSLQRRQQHLHDKLNHFEDILVQMEKHVYYVFQPPPIPSS